MAKCGCQTLAQVQHIKTLLAALKADKAKAPTKTSEPSEPPESSEPEQPEQSSLDAAHIKRQESPRTDWDERYRVKSWRKDGDLYVSTFLIDDDRNGRGWRVSWDSIKRKAKTFIGMPGIEYFTCDTHGCQRDHTEAKTYNKSVNKQKKYKVTTIADIAYDESTHTAYAIHRVERGNKGTTFGAKIEDGTIRYLSPSIWPNHEQTTLNLSEKNEWYINTTDWEGLHDAFVDNPAYGHKARVIDTCRGGDECITKLKQDLKQTPKTP